MVFIPMPNARVAITAAENQRWVRIMRHANRKSCLIPAHYERLRRKVRRNFLRISGLSRSFRNRLLARAAQNKPSHDREGVVTKSEGQAASRGFRASARCS